MTEIEPPRARVDKRATALIILIVIMMMVAMVGVVKNMDKNDVKETMVFEYVGANIETVNGTSIKITFYGNASIYDVTIEGKNAEREYKYVKEGILANKSEPVNIHLGNFVDEDMDVWITITDTKFNYTEKQQWRSAGEQER